MRLQDNHLNNFGLVQADSRQELRTVDGDRHFGATSPDKFFLTHDHLSYAKIFNNNKSKVLQVIDTLITRVDMVAIQNIEFEALQTISECIKPEEVGMTIIKSINSSPSQQCVKPEELSIGLDQVFRANLDIRLKHLEQAKLHMNDAIEVMLFSEKAYGKYPPDWLSKEEEIYYDTPDAQKKYAHELLEFISKHYNVIYKIFQEHADIQLNQYYKDDYIREAEYKITHKKFWYSGIDDIKLLEFYWGKKSYKYDFIPYNKFYKLRNQELIEYLKQSYSNKEESNDNLGIYLYGMFKDIPNEVTSAQLGFLPIVRTRGLSYRKKSYTVLNALIGSFQLCNKNMLLKTLPFLKDYKILNDSEIYTLTTEFEKNCDFQESTTDVCIIDISDDICNIQQNLVGTIAE